MTYNADMLITHEREKLINAIIFFADHVQFLGKVKLFKLLYFLDFGHFRKTGRSVTGMEYFAWKMGPVPVDLQEEIEAPEPDMCEKIRFEEVPVRKGASPMMKAVPLVKFDDTHFTGREMRLMRELAEEFKTAKAEEMVEATHLENLPWYKVYIEEGRKKQAIPYAYALEKQEEAILLPVIAEEVDSVQEFGQLEGTVISVGGKDKTKHIRLVDRDGKIYGLSTESIELARQFGNQLFNDVRVTGTGKWFRNENGKWELEDFLVQSCEPLEEASLIEAVAALRAIENDGWKNLADPLAVCRQLRGN